MKEYKIITIDECMNMSSEEIHEYIVNSQNSINENNNNSTHMCAEIDLVGASASEIAEKYGCIPIDDVFNDIRNKINHR